MKLFPYRHYFFTKKNVLLLFILSCHIAILAQDTTNTLQLEQLLQIVKKYHPVASQATINVNQTINNITIAKGAFDPVLQSNIANKTFDGTNYYNTATAQIQIPTWYGIDVQAGIESLAGSRLDPIDTKGNTSFVGVTVPLLKTWVIDKRRAYIQQAKIYNTMARAEQRAVLNDLTIDAITAYLQWVQAYQTYLIIKNTVAINQQRVALVTKAYNFGERPAIDTVEAITQLQSYQYLQNEYWLAYQNAGLQLSAYMWTANNQPYTLPNNVIPQPNWEKQTAPNLLNIVLDDLLQQAEKNHPELAIYNYKLDALTIDKRIKYQDILPKLDVTYNQLGKGYNLVKTTTTPLLANNYKYGIKFEIPLLLRRGTGEYQNAKLKIAATQLQQVEKKLAIQLKVKSYYNEYITTTNQIALQTNTYNNYLRLVKAEETRFLNGESSLFLINSRENKALESQQKLIELKVKYYKSIYTLQWSAGLLGN